jgi:hypothetical protein
MLILIHKHNYIHGNFLVSIVVYFFEHPLSSMCTAHRSQTSKQELFRSRLYQMNHLNVRGYLL